MEATQEQIETLCELQKLDRNRVSLKKTFDELPQRQKILDARSKQEQLKAKAEQVNTLLNANKKKIAEGMSKDASLEKRQNSLQSDIEASSDFRNIEKKTKELAGLQRLR